MTPQMQRDQQIEKAAMAADQARDDRANREVARYADQYTKLTSPVGMVQRTMGTTGAIVDKTADDQEVADADTIEARAVQRSPAPDVQTPKGIQYGSQPVTFTPEQVQAILAMNKKK